MVRMAVVKFGDGWRVQGEQRRFGPFDRPDDALNASVALGQQAARNGEDVELLVQDRWGRLERYARIFTPIR